MKGFNFQQLMVMLFGIGAIVLIVMFTPRYKVTQIGPDSFIKTEQTSGLYKRSKGKEEYHWDKIILYSGAAMAACGVGIFLTRTKDR